MDDEQAARLEELRGTLGWPVKLDALAVKAAEMGRLCQSANDGHVRALRHREFVTFVNVRERRAAAR